MGCERPRHRTFGTAGRQKPCEIPRMGGSCGRFSQLPVHERRHDRSGVVSSLARAHRELVLVGTTALFDRRIRSTLENDRRTHARQGRTYAHRLFAQPVRHRTGIPRALSGGCMGRHTGAGCLPQQRCRGHSSRGSGHRSGSWIRSPETPGNPMPYRKPAWRVFRVPTGGRGVLMQGIGEQRPAYVLVWRNALQTLKPGHFTHPIPDRSRRPTSTGSMLRHGRYSRPMQPTPFNNKQYRLNFRQ